MSRACYSDTAGMQRWSLYGAKLIANEVGHQHLVATLDNEREYKRTTERTIHLSAAALITIAAAVFNSPHPRTERRRSG
jgi:hypothetical protein